MKSSPRLRTALRQTRALRVGSVLLSRKPDADRKIDPGKTNRLIRPLAFFFVLSATSLAAYQYWASPTTFHVAVGPKDTPQVRFINALAEELAEGNEPVRLIPRIVDGSIGGSAALDGKKVELAVIRSDDLTSRSARAVAILHRRAVIIIGRSDRVQSFADLRGKRLISAQGAADSNKRVVESVLSHFGVLLPDTNLTEASLSEAENAFVQGTADALILVSPPAGKGVRDLVARLDASDIPFSFVDFPAPAGVVLRFPFLQTITIPAGVFGGTPPRPPAAIESVSITYELVASRLLAERPVAMLTKALLGTQLKNYESDGALFVIEAPPTDEVRRFMPHEGTKAFLNDNTQTLLEAYSDQIWLALFGFSLVGSSVTGFLAWMGLRKKPASDEQIHELPALMDRISNARTPADLDAAQDDLDKIIDASVRDYASGALNEENDSDRPFWLGHVQSLIEHRYEQLRTPHAPEDR
ncbi:MAG: transporter solute receptor, family [Hyphomicrobiales bacterium]|nr:transporter solute receptor, family [Hyphomicrobiales bacterium]